MCHVMYYNLDMRALLSLFECEYGMETQGMVRHTLNCARQDATSRTIVSLSIEARRQHTIDLNSTEICRHCYQRFSEYGMETQGMERHTCSSARQDSTSPCYCLPQTIVHEDHWQTETVLVL